MKKGYKFSDEYKKRMSLVTMGHKVSAETKRKIGLANSITLKGKKKTLEHIKNMANAHKGLKRSEETKKKMSVAMTGKHHILTEIGKEKVRLAGLKRRGLRHCTEETKLKIGLANGGNKSHFWKGGVTPIRQIIRESFKYKEWVQKNLIRDDFTCQKCNIIGGKLQVHHYKKSFSILIAEAMQNLPLLSIYDACMLYTPFWDVRNGQTLCLKCHKAIKHHWKINKI